MGWEDNVNAFPLKQAPAFGLGLPVLQLISSWYASLVKNNDDTPFLQLLLLLSGKTPPYTGYLAQIVSHTAYHAHPELPLHLDSWLLPVIHEY